MLGVAVCAVLYSSLGFAQFAGVLPDSLKMVLPAVPRASSRLSAAVARQLAQGKSATTTTAQRSGAPAGEDV
jgi:hypothetical protein